MSRVITAPTAPTTLQMEVCGLLNEAAALVEFLPLADVSPSTLAAAAVRVAGLRRGLAATAERLANETVPPIVEG